MVRNAILKVYASSGQDGETGLYKVPRLRVFIQDAATVDSLVSPIRCLLKR